MTRSVIPQPTRIERAARDACAYIPDGRLWQAKGRLPDGDDPLRAAKGLALGFLISLALWVIGLSAVFALVIRP